MASALDYKAMKAELLKARALFADPSFPPEDKSLSADGRRSNISREVRITWKRPKDMVKNPVFMVDGATSHDLDQGSLGNCWFIAGAAVMATTHRTEFERVVPPDQSFEPGEYTGMFRFNFWWYGKWVEIIVDDYLPTDGYNLLFCSNTERPNEFWPCLLEKAYAKLRGGYEGLDGGKIQDALVDMTGGISEVIDLQKKKDISPELLSLLITAYNMKTLMGAAIFKPENSSSREVLTDNGLYQGHAYSVTGFKQIPSGRGTVNLVRVRNPWGRGEWNGAWSDNSPEMRRLSDRLKEELMFERREDGEFWMSYDDFIANFDELELCHIQPDAFISELADNDRKQMWNVTVYHDAWIKGVTAGGCGNAPHQSLYWMNPQYYVTLTSPDTTLGHGDDCTLIVSLMEMEKNNSSKIAVGFSVYKLRNPELRPLDHSRAPKQALLLASHSGSFVYNREVSKRFELQPGTYVIIPSTYEPQEEAQFMLRIFTEKNVESGVLGVDVEPNRKPNGPKPDDRLNAVFDKHAGSDRRMDPLELLYFIEELSATELGDPLKFPIESCRSLVVLMNEDKSGFLNFREARKAWLEIKAYREVFKQFDVDKSNTVDANELGTLFTKLGFPLSRDVLAAIVRRYSGRDSRIYLQDFVMIICKLTSLFASFQKQKKKTGRNEDVAEFNRNEFLEVAMLT